MRIREKGEEIMLSVVIPVYNGEKYLHRSFDSVLSQPLQEMEIIIVNDGSRDGSRQIIEEYAARDSRIVPIHKENGGVSSARNMGLDRATGDHIFFFDCDDVLQENALARMYERALETDADLVIGNYRYLHEATGELQTPRQWVHDGLLQGEEVIRCCHLTCLLACKMWKRSMIEEHGLRFPKLKMGEDINFFLRYLVRCETVATMDICSYHYRIYDGSSSYSYTMTSADFVESFRLIEEDYRNLGGKEAYIKELMYDRMFYYVGALQRLPRYRTREDRRQLVDVYIRAGEQLDFSRFEDRKDIMDLVDKFNSIIKNRWLYESDAFAALYRTGRKAKHRLKKLRHKKA